MFSRVRDCLLFRGPRSRSDRGMSYVEVLVSVILLGTAGVAVLGAAASAARGASTQRTVADSQIVLAAASDGLNGVTPVACAQAMAAYQAVARNGLTALGLGRGWVAANVSVVGVQSFNASTATFDAGCSNASATQKITVQVNSPGGGQSAIEVLTGSATATTPIGNPLMFANSQFSMIARTDVTIAGDQVYGALAVGGNLAFTASGPIAANSTGTFPPVLGTTSNVGLIVDGTVDFAHSNGVLYVNSGASAVLGSMANGTYVGAGGTNCFTSTLSATQCTGTQIALQGGGNAVAGHPFDFAAAFDAFKKTSTALGALPGTCVNAASAVLRDQNNSGPWSGSGNFVLQLTSGKVNVLNLTAAQLNAMTGTAVGASNSATASTPLIINVTDQGPVSFTVPNFPQNYPRSVIWNFPNATSVAFAGALWGSLYAPFSTIALSADVRGVVIGNKVTGTGGVADWSNRPDINDIICDRSS